MPQAECKVSLCAAGAGKRYFDSLLYAHQFVEKEAVQLEKHLQNLCFFLNLESFLLRGRCHSETCTGLLWSTLGLLWSMGLLWSTPNMCQYGPTWACTGLLWDVCLAKARHLPSFIISPVVLLQGINDANALNDEVDVLVTSHLSATFVVRCEGADDGRMFAQFSPAYRHL